MGQFIFNFFDGYRIEPTENNPNGIFISNLKKRGMQDLEKVIANFLFKGITNE